MAAEHPTTVPAAPRPLLARPMTRVGRSLRRWWGALIVLGAVGCLVTTGIIGIDFGFHWDEPAQFNLVNISVSSGTLLPNGFYNYPSMTYMLSVLAVFPRVLDGMRGHTLITGDEFYVNARTLFLVVTSLGGIWLYFGLRRRAGELGAAFGAVTYLLSFQLAYHARWIAPDAVMAMTAALFLWFLLLAWDSPESRWRWLLPAVAAGLATATKYQGAVLMLPVLVLYLKRWRADPETMRAQLWALLRSVVAFLVTFLVITPGAVLQPNSFVESIRFENEHYRTTHGAFHGAFPYDVHEPISYLWRLTRYVLLSLPSHVPLLSLLVCALALFGVVMLARSDRWLAIALLLPCLIVPLYFATLTVFIVRNFLFLLPFVAFFAGIGVGRIAELARSRVARSCLFAGLAVVVIINGAWLVHAARSIEDRGASALVRSSDSFMRDRSDDQFVVSGPLRKKFRAVGEALPRNARAQGSADYLAVLYSQIRDRKITLREWPSTSDGTFRVTGPLEVDFDFYPTWAGDDRVLFLTPEEAHRFGLTRAELDIGG
jgi:hypothetical protein